MTMEATLFGELKQPFFKNDELFQNCLYGWMKNECKFVLDIMENYFTCNGIVHNVSIMKVSIFCQKNILLKRTHIR